MASGLHTNTGSRGKPVSRLRYVEARKARFGDELFGDPMVDMRKLQQDSSLFYYQRQFDGLLHRWKLVEKVSEKTAISQC